MASGLKGKWGTRDGCVSRQITASHYSQQEQISFMMLDATMLGNASDSYSASLRVEYMLVPSEYDHELNALVCVDTSLAKSALSKVQSSRCTLAEIILQLLLQIPKHGCNLTSKTVLPTKSEPKIATYSSISSPFPLLAPSVAQFSLHRGYTRLYNDIHTVSIWLIGPSKCALKYPCVPSDSRICPVRPCFVNS